MIATRIEVGLESGFCFEIVTRSFGLVQYTDHHISYIVYMANKKFWWSHKNMFVCVSIGMPRLWPDRGACNPRAQHGAAHGINDHRSQVKSRVEMKVLHWRTRALADRWWVGDLRVFSTCTVAQTVRPVPKKHRSRVRQISAKWCVCA